MTKSVNKVVFEDHRLIDPNTGNINKNIIEEAIAGIMTDIGRESLRFIKEYKEGVKKGEYPLYSIDHTY